MKAAINVRSVEARDLEEIAAIYAHEAVIANTAQVPYRTAQFWRDFYRNRDPDGLELAAIVDDRAVGHLGLIGNRLARRKHVASFGIAVHPDFQGRGVGSTLMGEMLHQADNWLNLIRIELAVASDNLAAIALYEKHGFVFEGQTRFDIFTRGGYGHTNHMARLQPGWEQAE